MAGSVRYELSRADYVAAARLAASPTRRAVVVETSFLAVGVLVALVARYLGYGMEGASEKLACKWRDLLKVKENRWGFLLFVQRRIFLMIPKSIFGNAVAVQDFSERLRIGRM